MLSRLVAPPSDLSSLGMGNVEAPPQNLQDAPDQFVRNRLVRAAVSVSLPFSLLNPEGCASLLAHMLVASAGHRGLLGSHKEREPWD